MNKRLNEKLLKDAFVEAMLRKYEREMEGCEESPICSPEHYEKISAIVGFDVTKPRRSKSVCSMRKKIVIIMIAAALALTGCVTGYIYRHEIGNFIEKFYHDHIEVWFDDNETQEAPNKIEKIYTLNYVPTGFTLVEHQINEINTYYRYQDSYGNTFVFEQNILNRTNQVIDNEKERSLIISQRHTQIYCTLIDNNYYYSWKNNLYILSINSTTEIHENELMNILNGIIEY